MLAADFVNLLIPLEHTISEFLGVSSKWEEGQFHEADSFVCLLNLSSESSGNHACDRKSDDPPQRNSYESLSSPEYNLNDFLYI